MTKRKSVRKMRRILASDKDVATFRAVQVNHRATLEHRHPSSEVMYAVQMKSPNGDWEQVTRDFGEPLLFETEGEANQYKQIRKRGLSGWKFQVIQLTKGKREMLKKPHEPNKIGSPKMPTEEIPQVEIRSEIAAKKFGVKTTCRTEADFHRELASTLVAKLEPLSPSEATELVRELLPHIADLVCVYRDYKCDRVQKQMMFLAGDLELPTE